MRLPLYHIALGKPHDLARIAADADQDLYPRHAMRELSQRLPAAVHMPQGHAVLGVDRVAARLIGQPVQWALARALASNLGDADTVLCSGEDIGVPLAVWCGIRRRRPKIAVIIHNLDRPRGRLAFRLFDLGRRIDLFITNTHPQTDYLYHRLPQPTRRLYQLPEHTDTRFFTPGPATPELPRPIITSVGLERRDYRTLAAATWDLAIDVKISGFSRDVSVLRSALPDPMPANMTQRFYEWPELRQLYRDAAVVVVSVLESKFAAGSQALLEALACRRPVIVTKTTGIQDYVNEAGIVTTVPTGDAAALRQAITFLLTHPEQAATQAQRGYTWVQTHHTSDRYVNTLVSLLTTL